MSWAGSEQAIERVLDAIYDAAVRPGAWPGVLEGLAGLFRCHFADVFERSHDRMLYRGQAFGLDRADYQDLFLDTWFKRNVWGLSHPTRDPGEVVTTREMVETTALVRTEIYADYLNPRDLHEGLRLALAADVAGIQDISMIRAWSAGPFETHEIALAHRLLPHLQRAAAVARRLHAADLSHKVSALAIDRIGLALLVLDARGAPVVLNAAAERILGMQDGLRLQGGALHGASRVATQRLQQAIAASLPRDGHLRTGTTIRMACSSGAPALTLVILPFREETSCGTLRAPAALILLRDPAVRLASPAQLAGLFGLTDAEAELAAQLLAGQGLREIAVERGRSIHTVRNQLARLMDKTETTRRSELLGVLRGVPGSDQL